MGKLTFADRYNAAYIDPGRELIQSRILGFDKLRAELDLGKVLELTRLYFGLDAKKSTDWFRDAFHESDSTFSMQEKREVAVLAAILLITGVEDDNPAAGLAPLTLYAFGSREHYLDKLNIIPDCDNALNLLSLKMRQYEQELGNIDDISEEITEEESSEINVAINPLLYRLANLEEEHSILSWCFAGWSKTLKKPFTDLKPALVPVVAGYDMAVLTTKIPGPVAAHAIFHRLLSVRQSNKTTQYSIEDVVKASQDIKFENLISSKPSIELADLCPVLTAFRLVGELGSSSNWQDTFKKQVGMDAISARFSPLDLSMQVYREAQLISLYPA